MNKQVNPDHCYETEDGVMYMLESAFKVDGVRDSPEWHVLKDGRKHQTFTSLMAAKGWLEHTLENGSRYLALANEWRTTLPLNDPRRESTVVTRPNDPASMNFLDAWNFRRKGHSPESP